MPNASLNNLLFSPPPIVPASAAFTSLTDDSGQFGDALWRAGQSASTSVATDDALNDDSTSNGDFNQTSVATPDSSDYSISSYSTNDFSTSDSSASAPPSDSPSTDHGWHNTANNSGRWSNESNSSSDDPSTDEAQSSTVNRGTNPRSSVSKSSGTKSRNDSQDDSKMAENTTSGAPNNTATQNVANQPASATPTANGHATAPAQASTTATQANAVSTIATQSTAGAQGALTQNTVAHAAADAVTANGDAAGNPSNSANGVTDQPESAAQKNVGNTADAQQQQNASLKLAGQNVDPTIQTDAENSAAVVPNGQTPTSPAVDGQAQSAASGITVADDLPNAELVDVEHKPSAGTGGKTLTPESSSSDAPAAALDETLNSALDSDIADGTVSQTISIQPAMPAQAPAIEAANAVGNTPEKSTASRDSAANKSAALPSTSTPDLTHDVSTNSPAQLPAADSQSTGTTATAQRAAMNSVDPARFVQRVANAFRNIDDQGDEIRLRLSPPELGSLKVEVAVRNGVMTARMEAENNTARSLLLDNLPALKERLSAQNIKVERFDVDVRQDGRGQGSANAQSDSAGSRQNSPRSPNFTRTAATSNQTANAVENQTTSVNTADKGTINVVV
jgi:flagellar hook-length control protein FliK